MLERLATACALLFALVLFGTGFCTLVGAPFLPLAFLDLDPPPWLTVYTLLALGLALMAAGTWLWCRAWKRWLPPEAR